MRPQLTFQAFLGGRVHLGVTGSIAAYKTLELLRALKGVGLEVGVTLTGAAARFVTPLAFEALGAAPVYQSMFAPDQSPFAHLEPGQIAKVLAVVPASANFLAKAAHGLADDILSCQHLAFSGPVLVAPAMNQRMWAHPATQANWRTLLARGVIPVGPDSGHMACGETGQGRLAPLEDIFCAILAALAPQDLKGRKILITLGPTHEYWDAARLLTNPSTGLMGACLAVAAHLRGAAVQVVRGPVDIFLPAGIQVTDVTTAAQMHAAALDLWPSADIGCLCAAVSDYRPEPFGPDKFKRQGQAAPQMTLVENPDILFDLGRSKRAGQTLIGFAAETGNLLEHAQDKLARKNLDLIVANRIGAPDTGFAAPTNAATVLDRKGRSEEWPLLPKTEVAWRVWDWLSLL